MIEEKVNVYCHECADVTGYDDESLCSKCHGDNTMPYTDAEARAWAGIATPTAKPCSNWSPPEFTGRWRDWHRGHGCDRDDGQPRTEEGAAEIAGIMGAR